MCFYEQVLKTVFQIIKESARVALKWLLISFACNRIFASLIENRGGMWQPAPLMGTWRYEKVKFKGTNGTIRKKMYFF